MNKKRKIFIVLCLSVAMCASILPLFASANTYYMPSSYITEYEQEFQSEDIFTEDIIINIEYTNLNIPYNGATIVEIKCSFFPSEYSIYEETDGVIVTTAPELSIYVSGYVKVHVVGDTYFDYPITKVCLTRKDTLYDFSYYKVDLYINSLQASFYVGDPNLIYPGTNYLVLPFDGITLTVDNNELSAEESIRYEVLGSLFDIPRPIYSQFTHDYKIVITNLIETIINGIQQMFLNETYASIVYIFMAFSVGAMAFLIIFKFWR